MNLEKFYVVGVEILSKFIHVSIVRIDFETVYKEFNREFRLEDTDECLYYIRDYIYNAIQESGIKNEQIIGVGIGVRGAVNGHTGEHSRFFNRSIPFKSFLEEELKLPVRIDNNASSVR
ncbi:MAG: ROK family protein [Saprospiraceae bacterium]